MALLAPNKSKIHYALNSVPVAMAKGKFVNISLDWVDYLSNCGNHMGDSIEKDCVVKNFDTKMGWWYIMPEITCHFY